MYRLFYDGEVLHDPRDDKRRVTECKVELESNTAGTLTFKIAPAHPLFGKLQAMDTGHEVIVMDDTVEVFRGRIKSDGKDMQTVTNVTCEGQLAYLNDSVVRAYGTYASDDENWTVVKGDNIFRWYVSQHNGQSDANKQFVIGKCETGYGLTRSSTQHPTTGQEIKEKLLDALSCYIDCYMDNGERILDLLEFGGADAEQSIEFGTNLLDYATTRDASSIITDIIPTGTDNDNNAIDITSLRDGDYGSCYKEGDHVSFSAGVNLYGHITEARSYDGTTPSELLNASINDLQTAAEVIESVNIKAVDLHNVDPTVKPIRLNEWVLVSSKPHGVYQPMMCVKMTIDINDPTQTVYTFGATLPSLTSDNVLKVAQNRQRQEEMIVAAAAISVDAKAAAELATTAQSAADAAKTTANAAQTTADTASTTASTALANANKAQTSVDGLEVGGRNLIFSSDGAVYALNGLTANKIGPCEYRIHGTNTGTVNYAPVVFIDRYTFFNAGDEYTVSVTSPAPLNTYIGINTKDSTGKNIQAGTISGSSYILGNDNKRYASFRVNPNSNGSIYGFIGVTPALTTIDWTFKVKIEKGNRATDWTPAPEDVDASIATANSAADAAKTTANAAQTTADTASTTASTANSTANTAQATADTAKTNAATAQSAADAAQATLAAWCYNNNLTYIDGGNIYTGSVAAAKIAANAITADKIAAGAITADKFYGTAIASTNYAPEGTGMKIDLASGTIDTKNFKVDSAGNTTIKNGGITVKNNDGTEVFSTDANGDLEITGALRMSGSQSVRVDNAAGTLVGQLFFEPISGVTWSPGALKVKAYDYLTLEAGTDCSIPKAYGCIRARGTGLAMFGSEDYGSSGDKSFFCFGRMGELLGVETVSTSTSTSEKMTFRGKQFPQIIFGSMVYAVANDSAVAMFDNNALGSKLGAMGVNNLNTVVVVGNGDGAACNAHCQDCTYMNGTWHATFDRIFTGNVRVNYAVITYA